MHILAISNNMLPELPSKLAQAGQVANQIASKHVFQDYRERKAKNTLRRQDADLALFAKFHNHLHSTDLEPGKFAREPEAWNGITWGLLVGFVRWMLVQGYAVGSVNVRLSTIKTYAKLAMHAGVLLPSEYALIRAVSGYSRKEAASVDEKRETAKIPKRKSTKKAESVILTQEQVQALKNQPDTPQGCRDAFLICLLVDHGLRCGEVALLKLTDLDLKTREIRFYRPKMGRTQVHELTADTLEAAQAYFEQDAPVTGALLRGSYKDGNLRDSGMSERAITKRVETLGAEIKIDGLSAHDLRHTWATKTARNGTPIDRLLDAGGWNSLTMPLRYVEAAKVANKGMELGD